LIPSPFGRGERNNKRIVGLVSDTLAIGCERGRGVDPELPEHGGDIRGWGGCRDRSRTKDGSDGTERLHGGEVDDGNGDIDRGVDGVLLRKWDRGVSNGSSGILIGEVIVSVRGHIGESVLVKEVRESRSGRMRRLSDESVPYMCCWVGVGSFELPHLIISKDVILIDPHVVRVRVSFPFDQIL
jgi:hypothetical protein